MCPSYVDGLGELDEGPDTDDTGNTYTGTRHAVSLRDNPADFGRVRTSFPVA